MASGFGAQVCSLRAEARQDGVAFGGGFRVLPVAALQWQQVNNQGYTESSYITGTVNGVTVTGQSQTSLRSELGAQVDGVARLGAWVESDFSGNVTQVAGTARLRYRS